MDKFTQIALDVAADQQITGTILGGVSELACPVQPNDKCYFKFCILFQQSLLTSSMKLDLFFPSNPAKIVYNIVMPAASGAVDATVTSTNRVCIGSTLIAANTDYLAQIDGVLINGVNSGLLQPQFASSGLGTVTVRAGSSAVMTNL